VCGVCVVFSQPAGGPNGGKSEEAKESDGPVGEEENQAAAKIQALARGQLVRKQQKDQRLWEAWNELDWVSYNTNTC
jgi:hypothetical protein